MNIAHEPTKKAFQSTWPGGYAEQFGVYEKTTGDKEVDIVNTCLKPFYNRAHTVLEVGCGKGFWVGKYLLPNFARVIGIDVIPKEWLEVSDPRFTYIELPDRDYTCHGVPDASIDYVWSFGCLCHLPIEANAEYVKGMFRVLKPGCSASVFFSNDKGRPGAASKPGPTFNPDRDILWCSNDWERSRQMMADAGFVDIRNFLPANKDTFAYGRKP